MGESHITWQPRIYRISVSAPLLAFEIPRPAARPIYIGQHIFVTAKIKAMIAAGVSLRTYVHARGQFNDSLMCNFYPIR